MYPMEPKDALQMVRDHQDHLRERVSRERLATSARVERPDGGRLESPRGSARHGLRAGAGRLVHSLVAGHGSAA